MNVELLGDGVVWSGGDGGHRSGLGTTKVVVNVVELDVVAGDSGDVQVVELDGLSEGQVESLQPVGALEDLGTDLHPGR